MRDAAEPTAPPSRHVTPKKKHEIRAFCRALDAFHERPGELLLDCGAGKGHLARHVCLDGRYRVVAVEREQRFQTKAKAYDEQLNRTKRFRQRPFTAPEHIRGELSQPTMDQLSASIGQPFSVVGLHSCGQLALDMVRMFERTAWARRLFLCFCCYHKTASDRCLLSRTLRDSGLRLSVASRANACHHVEQLIDELGEQPDRLKVHAYRAMLEHLLERGQPHWRKRTLAKVRDLHQLTFAEYARLATRKLDGLRLDALRLQGDLAQRLQLLQHRVLTFYCVRTLLGPLCETLLLLDKLLRLTEPGLADGALLCLFDSRLSARCFLLVASKRPAPASADAPSS